jgi:hypothetical protein
LEKHAATKIKVGLGQAMEARAIVFLKLQEK